eukprot:10658357-Lingulodinium_polyedra.AAC.1
MGGYATALGSEEEVCKHLEARAQAAVALAERARDLAHGHFDVRSFAKAWCVLQKSCAHALDYDARILPPSIVRPR